MKPRIAEVRIKDGMPTAEEARRRLAAELEVARRRGIGVLKLIHGYGSSGVGGRLRHALRASLQQRREVGSVGRVIPGESWSIFDETSRSLLERFPELRNDADMERGNAGITIVELK